MVEQRVFVERYCSDCHDAAARVGGLDFAALGRDLTNAETLRRWVRQGQVDTGQTDGVTSESAREIRELKRKNAELERTIEILKAATSFFARESDPRQR